jgi:hypothetical protein
LTGPPDGATGIFFGFPNSLSIREFTTDFPPCPVSSFNFFS